jgi:hypothetical protein
MSDGSQRIVDLSVVVVANLTNLFMATIFLARFRGMQRIEYYIGLAAVAMVVPLGVAVGANLLRNRAWWSFVLPLVLIVFLLVELLLDYILKIPFRDTALLWPYIVLFYAGLMAMIGYSFLVDRICGFVTLVTYFIQLAVMLYTHVRKGIHEDSVTG